MNRQPVGTEVVPRQRVLTVTAGLTIAALAAVAGIAWAADPQRRAWEVATLPFGWTRLVVIHALSTLMLAWSSAWQVARWRPGLVRRTWVLRWAVVGLLAVGLSALGGGGWARMLDTSAAGSTARLVVRILWCWVLELPWCLATLARLEPRREPAEAQRDRPGRRGGASEPTWSFLGGANAPNMFSTATGFALALLTALGVPLSFLAVFLEQQTELARQTWQRTELVATRRIVQRLADVGSTASLGERPAGPGASGGTIVVTPRRALRELDEAIAVIRGWLERHAPAAAQARGPTAAAGATSPRRARTLRERVQRAQYYLALDQAPQAEAVLAPVADRDPAAALLLARIAKRSGAIDDCRARAETALRLAQQARAATAGDREAREAIELEAYQILAVCAGERADFQRAEQILLEALERLPRHSAAIHDRLGKHYAFIGDLPRALAHQREATRLDPATYPPPESLLRRILSTGAPVGLARPKSSRYQ